MRWMFRMKSPLETILPPNCKQVLSDGLTVPVLEGSAGVAYEGILQIRLGRSRRIDLFLPWK